MNALKNDLLVMASAPCRIDLAGTLDISTLYLPLRRHRPCTFNIALDLRTVVRICDYRKGRVNISSFGFDSADFPADALPFAHPMGLLFAVVSYFGGDGIHIDIQSQSPPRSGLGGSSVAAVALIAALDVLTFKTKSYEVMKPVAIARLAHAIESGVAGVPCGIQDQLAAAFGGANAWIWGGGGEDGIERIQMKDIFGSPADLSRRLLVAYCGTPHDSKDINARWISQFINAESRHEWMEIIDCSNHFVEAIRHHRIGDAVAAMNRETDIRVRLTPDVFNKVGYHLISAARTENCGGRFTGAGGGGCVWALGEVSAISRLRGSWDKILADIPSAGILDTAVDPQGVMIHYVS